MNTTNTRISKNDIVNLTITGLGINGEGVARLDNGMAVFVTGALVGEVVAVKLILIKKNFAIGKLIDIIERSSARVEPKCVVFGRCGGCALQHLEYNEQLKYKTQLVKDTLARIGGVECNVELCESSNKQYGYRNKIQLPIAEEGGEVRIGFFRSGSHNIVEIERCDLHEEWADKLIKVINQYINLTGVSGYNESTGKGLLRHVVARYIDNKLLICLVINGKALVGIQTLMALLKEEFGEDWGLYTSSNTARTNVIMGASPVHISGLKVLEGVMGGINFAVRIVSFLQVNEDIAHRIYSQAVSYAGSLDSDIIIDAYSGIGILTAMLSRSCQAAVGIEVVSAATEDADSVMERNHITNVVNITGDCGEILPQLLKGLASTNANNNLINNSVTSKAINFVQEKVGNLSRPAKITVVLDPARKGCDEQVLQSLIDHKVNKIIYISCNPSTLARDIGILKQAYCINFVQPYDMFPQTPHVETVVLMSRVDK